VRPIHLDSVSHYLHLPVAAASTLLLCALTAGSKGLTRLEGALLLALYAGYIAVAIALST
jgi:Ca2+/Na+ antiporter